MALTLLAANNAQTVLAAGISASATSMTVNTGTGNLFPSPVSGASFFKLTLIDAATGQISEIVHVTGRSGDNMTISRAQEGTTARAWSANDIAANMMTAGTISYIMSNTQPLDAMLTSLASLNTVNLQFPVFNGPKSIGLGALTNLSLDFLSKSTSADMLSLLLAAPVNSPTFTGDPKAPTPAAGDNDTSIATTAFVAKALTGYQPKSTQLTEFANVALANYTFPFRNGSGVMQGGSLSVLSLDFLSRSTASDMRSVLGLGSASQRDVGTSSGQIPDMGSFTSAKSLIGYQRLPNGVILQWGSGNTTTSGASVTFPIAFPTTCTAICANERNNAVSPVVVNFSGVGTTGFTIQAWNTSATRVDSYISWYAIGY